MSLRHQFLGLVVCVKYLSEMAGNPGYGRSGSAVSLSDDELVPLLLLLVSTSLHELPR